MYNLVNRPFFLRMFFFLKSNIQKQNSLEIFFILKFISLSCLSGLDWSIKIFHVTWLKVYAPEFTLSEWFTRHLTSWVSQSKAPDSYDHEKFEFVKAVFHSEYFPARVENSCELVQKARSSTLLNFFSNPRGYFLKNQSDFTQKSRAGKILGMENGLNPASVCVKK